MVIANNFSITTIFNVKAEITHIFYTFYMFILLLLLKVKYMKEEYFKWYSPNLNREIDVSFGHSDTL
jgi:hypothetical protein